MAKRPKIQISRRALVQRINRKLSQNGEQLKARRLPKGERTANAPYYVVNVQRAWITREHVRDLEALGRELRALEDWEEQGEEVES